MTSQSGLTMPDPDPQLGCGKRTRKNRVRIALNQNRIRLLANLDLLDSRKHLPRLFPLPP
jgi:hypothetical protein